MVHDLRTLHSLGLVLLATSAIAVNTGCSSDNSSDGGTDSGIHDDAFVVEGDGGGTDAIPHDIGPRPDVGPFDGGHFCAANDSVQVGATNVHVGAASMVTLSTGGNRADTSCSKPMMGAFNDPMFLRGCLN